MTIFREYENRLGEFDPNNKEHQERLKYQCQLSFSGIDHLYIIMDDKKPIGFTATEDYEDEGCSVVRDIIVETPARGQGYSKKLYSLIFENPQLQTLLGYSKTPEAIESRISTGNEHDFKSYYGSEGEGIKEAEIAMKRILKYMEEHGLLVEGREMPAGYALLKGELEILPTQQLDLSLIKDESQLKSLNKLNELQAEELQRNEEENEGKSEEHKKLPDTVVGLMTSIRAVKNK